MKNITLFLIIFLMTSNLNAQTEVKNLSLSDPAINELYVGVDNKVWVENPDVTTIRYGSEIIKSTKENSHEFHIHVATVGMTRIDFWKDDTIAFSKEYQVKRFGDPTITIGHRMDATISTEELLADPTLYIHVAQKDSSSTPSTIQSPFELISATITFVPSRGEVLEYEMTNAKLSEELLKQVTTMKKGGTILIEKVNVKSPDGVTRKIIGRSYSIN